jgi:hypothetical protein
VTVDLKCVEGKVEGIGTVEWFIYGKLSQIARGTYSNGNLVKDAVIESFDTCLKPLVIDGKVQGFGCVRYRDATIKNLVSKNAKERYNTDLTFEPIDAQFLFTGWFVDSFPVVACLSEKECDARLSNVIGFQRCDSLKIPVHTNDGRVGSFFGDCPNKVPMTGIVIWNQAGEDFSISCLDSGSYSREVLTRPMEGYSQLPCIKYLPLIPRYCEKKGSWMGQCKDGAPDGVGFLRFTSVSSRHAVLENRHNFAGQVKVGKMDGYGIERIIGDCGMLGCTGNDRFRTGWFVGGEFSESCEGGFSGCIALRRAQSTYTAALELSRNLRCEEALKMDQKAQKEDLQSHSSEHLNNGRRISYSSCIEDRNFEKAKSGRDPAPIYLLAGEFERKGSTTRANDLYQILIDKFPRSELAIKANDRLLRQRSSENQGRSSSAPSGRGGVARLERLSTGAYSLGCSDGTSQVLHDDKDYRTGVVKYCAQTPTAGYQCSTNASAVAVLVCQ